MFREGHLYDARVIGTQTTQFNFPGTTTNATTAYDVLQKLSPTAQPLPVIYSFWQNTRAYAPMYEAPANVAQAGQISPINLLPFLEKLFVATTYPPLAGNPDGANDPRSQDISSSVPAQLPALANCYSAHAQPGVNTNPRSWPSLFDMRCGEDPYDSQIAVRNPATAQLVNVYPFGIYGDSETDPNDGSLWNFGAYARRRLSTIPTGQWGTFAANYKLSFPEVDPYGNSYQAYTDVPSSSPFAGMIRIAKQVGIVPADALGSTFQPTREVTRSEMARWTVLSQMNEAAITDFLANTPQFGGPRRRASPTCRARIRTSGMWRRCSAAATPVAASTPAMRCAATARLTRPPVRTWPCSSSVRS
ncbi:MAG: S-layer homology domain-containing protein [Bryobacterales bacterium]|nr:S-layer homology domain-containing protein [Bryobacterales bacterium]